MYWNLFFLPFANLAKNYRKNRSKMFVSRGEIGMLKIKITFFTASCRGEWCSVPSIRKPAEGKCLHFTNKAEQAVRETANMFFV